MDKFLWMDVAGTSLDADDRDLLRHPAVSGVILFSRNYESPQQLSALTREIRSLSPYLHITVDQEGGRVQRFRDGFTLLPALRSWGAQYRIDSTATKAAMTASIYTMITELRASGVDSTLVPVLDIDYGHNAVIGERAFGDNPALVSALGEIYISVCHTLKMPVTIKHFPGHGYVSLDSHLTLPVDTRSFKELAAADLQPFHRLAQQADAVMLAHVLYSAVDKNPPCFSRFWIQDILRGQLQFRGRVLSDDLSMRAVAPMGTCLERVARALAAGCDTVLVCNARAEVIELLNSCTSLGDLV